MPVSVALIATAAPRVSFVCCVAEQNSFTLLSTIHSIDVLTNATARMKVFASNNIAYSVWKMGQRK